MDPLICSFALADS